MCGAWAMRRFDLAGRVVIPVCDLEGKVRMKRATRRPKDRVELEILAALRAEREASGAAVASAGGQI